MNLPELRAHVEAQKRLKKATVTLSIEDAEELLRLAERPLHQSQGYPGMVVVKIGEVEGGFITRDVIDAVDTLVWHQPREAQP